MEEGEPWEAIMRDIMHSLIPTLKLAPTETEIMLPKIPNLVTSMCVLRPKHRLPLLAIARRMPHAQYAPGSFAACIIKMRDSVSEMTALAFGPGSVVVVASRTYYHALYRSQMVRMSIECTHCPMYTSAGTVVHESLSGRLVFEGFNVHNWVGHGQLGFAVDLDAMCRDAPLCCTHHNDLFPGLKCKVWLTQSYQCECKSSSSGCKCSIKVLVFKTGKVVIPGGATHADINCVFYRIRVALERYNVNSVQQHASEEAQIVSDMPREMKRARRRKEEEVIPADDAAATAIHEPQRHAGPTPLMQMAEAGRLDDVCATIEMFPHQLHERDHQGYNILERMNRMSLHDQPPNHHAIVHHLQEAITNAE